MMGSSLQLPPPLRVANCSGFYGDRLLAAREMVEGGQIDVLTGDWLAELTMLILSKSAGGFARTFVTQMEQVMGACLERNIKVVSNAGGLNPQACAEAVLLVAERLGLHPKIATVSGDNVMLRLADCDLRHLDTGADFGDRTPITANAYLGGWGIADALQRGADIVVTGRVTDAAVVVGPAAWHFDWKRDDWNQLAGAVVAGHLIECGAQVTGGNYSFFEEVPDLRRPGFPIAEMYVDGSCVITKHEGTGGLVDVGTVTAQLLYEIQGARYLNPDVTARFDTVRLLQEAPDRVRVSQTVGEPPPPTTKVCINVEGGFRNRVTFCLTGLDIERKAALVEETFWSQVKGGRESFSQATTQLIRTDKADPATNEEAVALLHFTVKDSDERKVGRSFSNVATEMALSTYPGMFGLGGPSSATAYGVYWPARIASGLVPSIVEVDGVASVIQPTAMHEFEHPFELTSIADLPSELGQNPVVDQTGQETVRAPIGRIIGARSGDKGGNANIGVWTKTDEAFEWIAATLTVDRLRLLLPEARLLDIRRVELRNVRAVNFVLVGLLEEGVAASTRMDAQAKGLGEYLRAKYVDIPKHLLRID